MAMTTEYAQGLVSAGLSYKTAFERLIADLKAAQALGGTTRVNELIPGLIATCDLTRAELLDAGGLLLAEEMRLRTVAGDNRRTRRYMARKRAMAAAGLAYSLPINTAPESQPTPVARPQGHPANNQQPIDYTALAESAAITPELEELKNLFE